MTRVIILPNGKQCGLPTYVHAWKTIQRMVRDGKGSEEIKGFGDWPEAASNVLRRIQYGVDNRVNIRGGLVVRHCDPYKCLWKRIAAGKLVRSCKWCGEKFKSFGVSQWCCSAGCGKAYRA
jgi:hypothetical protein